MAQAVRLPTISAFGWSCATLPPYAWVVLGWQPTAVGGLLAPASDPCMCMRCCRRQLMGQAPSGRLPHVRSCPSCSARPGMRLTIPVHRALNCVTSGGRGLHASVAGWSLLT